MTERQASPAEQTLRLHLESGRFRSGVAAGRWWLVQVEWPHASFGVKARDDLEYGFRFECTNYPKTAPTAQPWDLERNAPLAHDKWPTGSSRVPLAFNPGWKNGTCLYLPCDRQSIEGHQGWITQHPALLWDPEKGICKYLGIIHELLNSSDYGGRRAA